MPPTRPLDPIEIRVLGVLLEKEQTTPDYYPLTISATIAACNQKSNRDPVMQLTETQVVEALDRLFQGDTLAWRSTGARAERWEHRLDRRWHLTPAKKAIMTLLLLRGPQTAGELKSRSGRMYSFESLAEVETTLRKLAEGFDSIVREMPRQPGKREIRWTHIVSAEDPDEALDEAVPSPAPTVAVQVAPEPEGPTPVERLETLEKDVERLETLEKDVAELREELTALRRRLGDLE